MRFAEDANAGNTIRAYSRGEIIVAERRITESVIIGPDAVQPWPPASTDALEIMHFEALLEMKPEVVVLGTGDRLTFPAAELAAVIQTRGIGLEVMATDAACRTFNILLSEDRRVVAGLILG
jgi:uncharacterized protein